MKNLIPHPVIENKIFIIRSQKVMLSNHLAELYGVKTKVLLQAVKRNIDRFPPDFMFPLTRKQAQSLRSQFVTLDKDSIAPKRGKHTKYLPYAFTEEGVAMLSSVLRSKKAIYVNIEIMRTFVKLRKFISAHKEISYKLNKIEKTVKKHSEDIRSIFEVIRQLMEPPPVKEKPPIGFRT